MIKITDIQETQTSSNPIIREMNEMGHEQVVFCQDQETGMQSASGQFQTQKTS